ncbi:MAG: hypothetical protein IT581_05805 [Verrucomicrobiales bacterium]|nr:hypothetical protein [Verrucomicrobiales bacterium]
MRTTFTEPGWNIMVSAQQSLIDGEAVFVSTENRQNKVATVSINKSPGAKE